jgi:hypothetical protein
MKICNSNDLTNDRGVTKMKIYTILIGLIIACCLFSAQQVYAQTPNTYTYSTIDFDVLATGHTQADYQTGAYYQTTGAGLSLKDADGNQVASQQRQAYGLTVDVSAQTDGEADQQYEVDTGHYILATYYLYNYYYQGQYQNGYDDQYNYTAVEGQNWGTHDAVIFYGNGPLVVSQYTNDMILGQTKKTVKVGTPDHLWIEEDSFDVSPSCSTGIARGFFYKLVDVNNKGVGKASMVEDVGGALTDSCTGAGVTTTSTCSPVVNKQSIFPDSLFVGCPPPGVTDCGFDIDPQIWKWCPKNGGTPVPMAKIIIANKVRYRHQIFR